MNWNTLDSVEQLDTLIEESQTQAVAIFKHSTTCSISAMAKNRLERQWKFSEAEAKIYYLDLLSYRAISNEIASRFGVTHQSPQLILLKGGKPVYDASHNMISARDLPVESAV